MSRAALESLPNDGDFKITENGDKYSTEFCILESEFDPPLVRFLYGNVTFVGLTPAGLDAVKGFAATTLSNQLIGRITNK